MPELNETLTYLPWVRQGLISAVKTVSGQDDRIKLKVNVDISGGGGKRTGDVTITLLGPGDVTGIDTRQVLDTVPPHLTPDFQPNYFPSIQFDRPEFPWIFTPEATPEESSSTQQLKPWICLIVVERRDGVDLKYVDDRKQWVLSITGDAHKELPDLTESWAWVHAQVGAVSNDADLNDALKTQPDRTLSRLMCPRQLKGKTAYYACVVPTYLGGVQAGLGEDVSAKATELAWELETTPSSPSDIRLPVYYHWEFATGAEGDFEALVWQLDRRKFTFKDVGTRKLDISHAGYGLPSSDPVDLEGVLAPQATPDDADMVGPSQDYQLRLQALLNDTAKHDTPVLPPPIYGHWHAAQRTIPDIISSVITRDRPWLRSINLDPRYRVAAGLGAQVVRDQQEQLMASAWDQVGEIERANQILRQAKMARAASASIHEDRFAQLDDTSFLLVTGPVQPRVRYMNQAGQEKTAIGHVKASALPRATVSAQFRRMLRPRGVIARRFSISSSEKRTKLIDNVNKSIINPAPLRWPTPDGMLTMEGLLDNRSPCNTVPEALGQALIATYTPESIIQNISKVIAIFHDRQSEIEELVEEAKSRLEMANKCLIKAKDLLHDFIRSGDGGAVIELVVDYYKSALMQTREACLLADTLPSGGSNVIDEIKKAIVDYLPSRNELRIILFGLAAITLQESVEPCTPQPLQPKPPLDLQELKKLVCKKIDPHTTIAARVGAVIEAPGWKADDLDTIMAALDFPTPMYRTLTEKSQEWLLPGLERIPPNTITLLENNPRFIEAFMVGLNHEMSRELLWRGYPTDQRGTYFRQLWDPSGRFSPPKDDAERKANLEKGKDILPIHTWRENKLGESFGMPSSPGSTTVPQPTDKQLVLLIRGDLLRRYPRAMIYAAKAEWTTDAGSKKSPRNPKYTENKHPIFRGELAPDINFLGFEIDPEEAVGTDEPNDDKAGWFIVIQQQPTEPRYGLDESEARSDSSGWTWRDLAWPHVNLTETGGYIKLGGGVTNGFPINGNNKPKAWNWSNQTDSAQVACITLQGPVRVVIHASDLL